VPDSVFSILTEMLGLNVAVAKPDFRIGLRNWEGERLYLGDLHKSASSRHENETRALQKKRRYMISHPRKSIKK